MTGRYESDSERERRRRMTRAEAERQYYRDERRMTRAEAERAARADRQRSAVRADRHRPAARRRRRRRFPVIPLLLVLLLLAASAFLISKLGQMHRVDIHPRTAYNSGHYTNIALFGLDSREGELDGGVRSDTIMVVSINNRTKEIHLVSVFRDTYLEMEDGYYAKINSAYLDGPESAVSTLNKNLDLDIRDYAAVNFSALVDVIDLLGGIDIEMTDEEAYWTDMLIGETSIVTGGGSAQLPDENGGVYHCNGIQATAFCRIRYTGGSDFRRTERQREVLSAVLAKTKKADLQTLNRISDEVLPQISTSLDGVDLFKLALFMGRYDLSETTGFPFNLVPDWRDDSGAECVVPIDYIGNVEQLHAYLFPDRDYTASDKIREIHEELVMITGITPDYVYYD